MLKTCALCPTEIEVNANSRRKYCPPCALLAQRSNSRLRYEKAKAGTLVMKHRNDRPLTVRMGDDFLASWIKRALRAEAMLAVFEGPIGAA